MTTREVFEALGPVLQPAVYDLFHRRDLCILSARVALDVCDYFGVAARPQAVRVVVYNRQFAAHVEAGGAAFKDGVPDDGSHSVGVGFGAPDLPADKWDGHLVVLGPDCFGDFSIQQAERRERGIITGPAVVSDYDGLPLWQLENDHATTLEYSRIDDFRYLRAPDWRDEARRHRLVGALIRHVRGDARRPRAAH